jgi:acetate kinase
LLIRDVIAAAKDGNKNAQLAIDAFVDNIVGYIGMFSAYMEGLDAIAFTGGIGQHSSEVRTAVLKRLAWLGVELDDAEKDRHSDGKITTDASKVAVYVLKTNEELMVARKTVEFLSK